MDRFIKICLLLAVLMHAGLAFSQTDVTLSWTPPTENTDGSALLPCGDVGADPADCLAGYRIYQGDTSGVYPTNYEITNPLTVSYIVPNLADGTYYFAATAYNASGIESDYSVEVAKVVDTPATPNPPLNLVVLEDNLTAYYISMTSNVIRTVPLGTVPPGTPCDTSMQVNGKYVVDRSELRPAEGVTQRPRVILAECG